MNISAKSITVFIVLISILACNANLSNAQEQKCITVSDIKPPVGFVRKGADGFGLYLRNLKLKPYGYKVHLFDGSEKPWQNGAYAVVDIEIGNTDLQQCADAVIRLRAEYLYANAMYDDIHFNFTNGFRADYTKWAEGYRIKVSGNYASWHKITGADYGYATFRKYLNIVFSYAGTSSLSRELVSVPISDIRIGDVFIHGGFPGHAMIVVDVAESNDGQKAVLVAQSYMPAQDIHIVTNLRNYKISPWYVISASTKEISFPEWCFPTDELKRFR